MRGAVIYISSNRENPEFENKIKRDMLSKVSNLPIFSVTQESMNFHSLFSHKDDNEGVAYLFEHKNICVGNVGVSGFNFCRQLQMAIEMAKVDYVISCEADCLYSLDYFTFVPPKLDRVYRNTNNYVIPKGKAYFHTKSSQTAFQIAGRDFLLARLNYLLKDQPQWNTKMKNFPKEIGKPFLKGWDTFKTKYPCFTIKTGDGMRHYTASSSTKVYKLPYWGSAKKIRRKYL